MTLAGGSDGGSARAALRPGFMAPALSLDIEGWQPADPVFGTSVVQIGMAAGLCPLSPLAGPLQRTYRVSRAGMIASSGAVGPSYSELSGFSGSVLAIRRRALDDALGQAASRGAHGVVGMTSDWRDLGPGVHQASWQGQAVRHPRAAPLERPFSCTLGAGALAKLLQSGFAPVSVVIGFAAVHIHAWATRRYGSGAATRNYELPTISDALSSARHTALRSLRDDTSVRRSETVVGLDLHLQLEHTGCAAGEGARLVTAVAVGTAAIRFGPPVQRRPRRVLVLTAPEPRKQERS